MKYTNHALKRLDTRLAKLVSIRDINKAVFSHKIPMGRSYLVVKQVEYTEIADETVKPDGIARGDLIVAVIDNIYDVQITTVLLRKSTSESAEYKYL